jgi:cytochrome c-type biogenesis protein CcmF
MRWPAIVALTLSLFVPLAFGRWALLTSLGLFLSFWILAGTLTTLILRMRTKITAAFLGMVLAHAGIGVFILGVTLVKSYEAERDVRLAPGETAELGGYAFRFEGVADVAGPNYRAVRGTFIVTRDGRPVARMQSEKRVYRVQTNAMTEAAIDTGLTRDLYVSLGDPAGGGAWTARLQVKPFVDWIWGGCVLMALGGLLAAADRRYRVPVRRREVPPPADATLIRREPA